MDPVETSRRSRSWSPAGTVATNYVAAADVTVAAAPWNVTVFRLRALNPVPEMVTAVPTGPVTGVKPLIDTRLRRPFDRDEVAHGVVAINAASPTRR